MLKTYVRGEGEKKRFYLLADTERARLFFESHRKRGLVPCVEQINGNPNAFGFSFAQLEQCVLKGQAKIRGVVLDVYTRL